MLLCPFRDKDRELRCELTAEVIARAYAAFVRLANEGKGELGDATLGSVSPLSRRKTKVS